MVLGINGLTGSAVAAEFAAAGWEVAGTGRDRSRLPASLAGVRFIRSDRYDEAGLTAALAGGADVVVDCLCYTAEHARQLVRCAGSFGSAIVLSSKAVYRDAKGRHSNSDEPPHFDGPVTEAQPVLDPDYSGEFHSREGYGANKVAAELTLIESGMPISILRPSRIHGANAARPREWWVVKRLLDGRTRIPLAHRGRTGNHPTAAVNLARLVRTCAERPGRRILNAADPGAPSARAIVEAVAAACGRPVEVVGLDDAAPKEFGSSPWATWPPFYLETSAAFSLGYEPAGSYADSVPAEIDELRALPDERKSRLTEDPYFRGRFDYALDDAALEYAAG